MIYEEVFALLARFAVPISQISVYVFFCITASVTWLTQFSRMDKFPEPVKVIIKIFFFGMLVTIPVFLAELALSKVVNGLDLSPLLFAFSYWFIVIAFVEETFKYLVMRYKVLKSTVFDEPSDSMIYMIVVALGFAGPENILYMLPIGSRIFSFNELLISTATVSFIRFLGANLLHALCSGLVGFFMAISICGKKRGLTLLGLVIAILLHGLYNFSIIQLDSPTNLLIPIVILLALTVAVTLGFIKLKKMKSVCSIK